MGSGSKDLVKSVDEWSRDVMRGFDDYYRSTGDNALFFDDSDRRAYESLIQRFNKT